MTEEKPHFAFGKNWKNYLKDGYSDLALKRAKSSMEDFLGDEKLHGKRFLDVGCGSGIHSLAALELGAKEVVSIDYDNDSVACCDKLKEANNSYDWKVDQGSILDDDLPKQLGCFDMVYCWGVAHHTGDMLHAFHNLAKFVSPGGFLYLAIYNKVPGRRGSSMWYKIKKFYNDQGSVGKKILEQIYVSWKFFVLIAHLKNPFTYMREYRNKRGMDWKVDLIDWLGGYPYEYASVEEIFHFFRKEYGFELVNIKTTNYIGNNQFLFKKPL